MAWLLRLREQDKSLPVFWVSAAVTGAVAILLMKQPDFGSTIIFGCVWLAMLALPVTCGRSVSSAAGLVGVVLAYFFYDVRRPASTASCSARATISRSNRCAR